MKITMYELLGLVKDGTAPLKFKVNNEIYEYDEDRGYICRHIGGWTYLYEDLNKGYIFLNDEVEILEEKKDNFTGWKMYQDGKEVCSMDCSVKEEKKIPEKINVKLGLNDDNKINDYTATNLECDLAFKINEILDYFESKGDE